MGDLPSWVQSLQQLKRAWEAELFEEVGCLVERDCTSKVAGAFVLEQFLLSVQRDIKANVLVLILFGGFVFLVWCC